jgi:hypothetical protein
MIRAKTTFGAMGVNTNAFVPFDICCTHARTAAMDNAIAAAAGAGYVAGVLLHAGWAGDDPCHVPLIGGIAPALAKEWATLPPALDAAHADWAVDFYKWRSIERRFKAMDHLAVWCA